MAVETIVNGTTIIINEQISYDWIGIIIASVIALITLIGIILTNQSTKESNDALKKSNDLVMLELINKFEPKLLFVDFKVKDEPNNVNVKFSCTIKNKGETTLQNVVMYTQAITGGPELKDILAKEKKIKDILTKKTPSFSPTTEISDFEIPFKRDNQKDIRIIMWFEFVHMNEDHEFIGLLDTKNLSEGGYIAFTHNQIKSEREKLN